MSDHPSPSPSSLPLRAAEEGTLTDLLLQYLTLCHQGSRADPKHPILPNLAGFCRFLGCGTAELEELRGTHPALLDRLTAILEDEALNALLSPTLLNAYLKRRLSYADKAEEAHTGAECGEMRLVFDHDILEDGE